MSFLFNTNRTISIEPTLAKTLNDPLSTDLSPQATINTNNDCRCYYADSNSNSNSNLNFFYGSDIPISGSICSSGLFSYGEQTQIPLKYNKSKYFHPTAIIYNLLFLWWNNFHLNIISILLILLIQLSICESLKIKRHCSMHNISDKLILILQLFGDLLLIPYHIINNKEYPLIQFQNTKYNKYIISCCKSMFKFQPTFWCKNVFIQFILAVIEEQHFFNKNKYHILREPIITNDNALIGLDWWVDPKLIHKSETAKAFKFQEEFEKKESPSQSQSESESDYAYYKDIYQSSNYYRFNLNKYESCFDDTRAPIIFIFTTYCGDSMSSPVRKLAYYFCSRGYRVVSYTKRGCGSPYYEMLPLISCKSFDLSGMNDAHTAIKHVHNRYPLAPKICVGFSLGGSQLQEFLIKYNRINKYFIAGIKIDGPNYWLTDCSKFGTRQNLISKILGEIVHSNFVKSLFMSNTCSNQYKYDKNKINKFKQNVKHKLFNFDKIISIKSDDCEIWDAVKYIMAPSAGFTDPYSYLHSVGPGDFDAINVPFLVLNTWNDGFQDPDDMPIGIANINPNIIHCVTRLGAHCIRREGLFNRNCWQSKIAFEFANAVLNVSK